MLKTKFIFSEQQRETICENIVLLFKLESELPVTLMASSFYNVEFQRIVVLSSVTTYQENFTSNHKKSVSIRNMPP